VISFEQALAAVRQRAGPQPDVLLAADAALGHVLAEDLIAPEPLPGFDNAAMDGFALSAAHLALPPGTPIALHGVQAAGDARFTLGVAACRIMTGAVVPEGTATVVPVEEATVHPAADGTQTFVLNAPANAGLHIRRAGEDVPAGTAVLPAGTRLLPQHRMLLAALGISEVRVRAPVMAAVLCTGAELVDDHAALAEGQIRNSNGPYLRAALSAMGATLALYRRLPDSAADYADAVRAAEQAGCRIILSTGAVSMGVHDFVPDALRALGADVVFHKLQMRPGKPTLFAVLPSGALLFGLPGNPMSCAVGARFFVQAALRQMQGLPPELPLRAVLQAPVRKKPGWTLIQKAALAVSDDAQLQLRVLAGQESFRIQPFAQANAWAVLPESDTTLEAGRVLECYPLQPALSEWPCVPASA
jgi:molybdopterin molybdotransferase